MSSSSVSSNSSSFASYVNVDDVENGYEKKRDRPFEAANLIEDYLLRYQELEQEKEIKELEKFIDSSEKVTAAAISMIMEVPIPDENKQELLSILNGNLNLIYSTKANIQKALASHATPEDSSLNELGLLCSGIQASIQSFKMRTACMRLLRAKLNLSNE